MTRRCSNCNSNGHNCRKCPTRPTSGDGGGSSGVGSAGVKLFGVRLTDGSIMKKSASMGNLSHYHLSSSASSPNLASPSSDTLRLTDGYASDGPVHASSSSSNRRTERKKGIPWTVEEHRLFLLGLKKLGKGDWRGISKNYVTSRTPTQVASHAQKYFVRQTSSTRRRRRSSLFDMYPESGSSPVMLDERSGLPPRGTNRSTEELAVPQSQEEDGNERSLLPFVDLSVKQEFEPMEIMPNEPVEETKENLTPPVISSAFQSFFPAFVSVPFQVWSSGNAPVEEYEETNASQHEILKPIPVLPKEPVNIDKLLGMSELSIGESRSCLTESSQLSLKLTGEPSRKSAFHANPPPGEKNQGYGHN